MTFELEELADFHDNNVKAWWQDILSNAELMLDDQVKKLKDLQAGKKSKKIDDDLDLDLDIGLSDDDIGLSDDDDLDIAPKK